MCDVRGREPPDCSVIPAGCGRLFQASGTRLGILLGFSPSDEGRGRAGVGPPSFRPEPRHAPPDRAGLMIVLQPMHNQVSQPPPGAWIPGSFARRVALLKRQQLWNDYLEYVVSPKRILSIVAS